MPSLLSNALYSTVYYMRVSNTEAAVRALHRTRTYCMRQTRDTKRRPAARSLSLAHTLHFTAFYIYDVMSLMRFC